MQAPLAECALRRCAEREQMVRVINLVGVRTMFSVAPRPDFKSVQLSLGRFARDEQRATKGWADSASGTLEDQGGRGLAKLNWSCPRDLGSTSGSTRYRCEWRYSFYFLLSASFGRRATFYRLSKCKQQRGRFYRVYFYDQARPGASGSSGSVPWLSRAVP